MLKKSFILPLLLFSLSCSAAQSIIEVIPLFNRPATEVQPLIAPMLEPTDHLVGKDFSIIVKTTPARLAEIKELIKKLDIALTNLSIRVIQSKDKTADQLNAGIDVGVNIPINRPSDFRGGINAYYQQNQQAMRSNNEQVLRTIEGKPAYIKLGGNYPVQYTNVYDYGYGQRAISNTTQYIEATTGFEVLPRLNGDRVTLDISPWSDQMQNNGTIDTQSAQTTLTAKLGQWVEIGTINEQSQSAGNGILSTEQGSGQSVVHILVQVEKVH